MVAIPISIQEPWFKHIINGEKSIEGRLCKGKFQKLKVGNILCINGLVLYKVTAIRKYCLFEDMLQKEGIDRVLPGVTSIQEGCDIYHQFYKKEEEDKYGVLAIELDMS